MSRYLRAIQQVARLVTVTGMSVFDACRIVAMREDVDADWLYRAITEK